MEVKPYKWLVSLLGWQQDNFNLKSHSARDKHWCVKPWCPLVPLKCNATRKWLIFSSRQSLPVQSWPFLGDAVALSPEQTLVFHLKKKLCPVYNPALFVRIGYTWTHGTEKCRNGVLCLHSHWSSDEIYGNRSGQNFIFFKSLNIYSEIGSCLCGSFPNSKNPINTYLHDRFTWFALDLLHNFQARFFITCNILQRKGISTSDWVHPSRSSGCSRSRHTQAWTALLGCLVI